MKVEDLNVGDEVVIIRESSYHCFKIGDVVEISIIDYKNIFHKNIPIKAWLGVYPQWVTVDDIKLVEKQK